MVLRSMNSLFTRHGRWVFAIITLIIIISFVGFLTPGFTSLFSGEGGGGSGRVVGTVFGKDVTALQMREQAERNAMFIGLKMNGMFGQNQIYEYASSQAFNNLCQLAAAKQRGIYVTDEEVSAFIEGLPMFRGADGQFSLEKFTEYDKKLLRPQGITQENLGVAIREGLMQEKLFREVIGSVMVTPAELVEFFNEAYEKYDVTAAFFKGDTFTKQVKIDQKELDSFFTANQKNYTIPAQYKIRAVKFGYAEFIRKAGTAIAESALKNYYEANKKEFEVKKGSRVEIQQFGQVKEKIRERLAAEEAKSMAKDLAQRFAVEVYKKISDDEAGRMKHFQDTADKHQRKVLDLNWISGASKPEAVFNEPVLLEEITKIYIHIPVSNAVVGENAAYVLLLENKKDSRPAQLKEVKQQAVKDLQHRNAITMAREKARAAAAAVGQATDKVAALKKWSGSCELKNPEPFAAMNPPYGEDGSMIAGLALNTPAGSVSKIENTPDGAMFVLVRKRTLPAAKDFEQVRTLVSGRYTSMKQESAKLNFSRWIQTQCKQYEQRGNQ